MKNVPLIIDITEINSYKSHLKANVIFGNCMVAVIIEKWSMDFDCSAKDKKDP